ncbi:MAG: nicotinate-nicotinamide nucleotide adenylyltransferase [Phycisphaeraceae bacterium]|nr:nicotinate-nicotinamide nucleotide adenylyltransferase [Phycisphaerae bacterium]MBX3393193.1 nicotinate-nicotinamide nucleotide adenylyltransferase [Phycisphaeraceae bacterium]
MKAVTPLDVVPGEPGIILVGGTFDPPHRGHANLAEAARRSLGLDGAWLVFVPAGRSPFKQGVAPGTPAHHRVAMVRRAVAGLRRSSVWTDEVDRQEEGVPSFWVETLRRVRSLVGEDRPVRFLIGADQACGFHRWREPREVLGLAEATVLPRGECSTAEQLGAALRASGFWSQDDIERWKSRLVRVGVDGVSSSRVRELLSRGLFDEAAEFLDPGVLGYAREHGLYRGGG